MSAIVSDGLLSRRLEPNGKYPDDLATACELSPHMLRSAARAAHDVEVNELLNLGKPQRAFKAAGGPKPSQQVLHDPAVVV